MLDIKIMKTIYLFFLSNKSDLNDLENNYFLPFVFEGFGRHQSIDFFSKFGINGGILKSVADSCYIKRNVSYIDWNFVKNSLQNKKKDTDD